MKNIKLGIVVCGIAGLAASFIGDSAIWKMHEAPGFMVPVLLTIIGFVAAAAMGAMSISKPPMQKWQAIVALVGSLASLYLWQKVGVLGEILKLKLLYDHPALMGILFGIGIYGGTVLAIIALVKPDDQK